MIGFLPAINIPGLWWINFGWLALAGGLLFVVRPVRAGPAHWLVLAFLTYAAASILWSPDQLHGFIKSAQFFVVAMAFWYGSQLEDIDHLYVGAAYGTAISVPIVIVQMFGWNFWDWDLWRFSTNPGGLFGNSATFGQTCALMLVPMAIMYRAWLSITLFTGVCLSGSRGAWLALLVATIAGRSYVLAPFLFLGLGVTFWLYQPNDYRVHMWTEIVRTLVPFGHGLGSFSFNDYGDFFLHAHNDLLELASELGIGILPLLVAGWIILRNQGDLIAHLTLVTFCAISLFAFPTFVPLSAFIAGLTAGHLVRREDYVWNRRPPVALARPAPSERAWD